MASSAISINIAVDPLRIKENHLLPEILEILQRVRPTWCAENIRAKVFTGGISNQLFGYYLDGTFGEDVVLLRVYGEGTDMIIDRTAEIQNIKSLHASGCCPPLYAVFDNGIVYGFVPGDTLDTETVRDPVIRRLIAKEIIHIHKLQPEGLEVISGFWKKLDSFLDLIPDSFEDPEKQKKYLAIIKSKDALRQEAADLKCHLDAHQSPIVFSHNDLLLKNIIYNKEKDSLTFIDHEYAMYNTEHYDIANHFCEYVGVEEVDFSLYPDKIYQLDWLRYYLEQKAESTGGSAADVTDKHVETCYVIVNQFALAAHLFWGVWSVVQARLSTIDFGYLHYAGQKIGEYRKRKEEFLGLQLPQ